MVVVGVSDLEEFGPPMRERLRERGIPSDAVVVELVAPFRPSGGEVTTLRSYVRPLVGGLEIQYDDDPGAGVDLHGCTLGFIAVHELGITSGFVVNGHCGEDPDNSDDTDYFQDDGLVSSHRIGDEYVSGDATWFTGGVCPFGYKCRRSDAVFARFATGCGSCDTSHRFGRIARPGLDSITWETDDTHRVVDENNAAVMVDDTVYKVGRTTGKTVGVIADACAMTFVVSTGRVLLCQALADYGFAGMDSGAPVFEVTNSPSQQDVHIKGIHWGGSGSIAAFSKWHWIEDEVGKLDPCAPNFSCL